MHCRLSRDPRRVLLEPFVIDWEAEEADKGEDGRFNACIGVGDVCLQLNTFCCLSSGETRLEGVRSNKGIEGDVGHTSGLFVEAFKPQQNRSGAACTWPNIISHNQ